MCYTGQRKDVICVDEYKRHLFFWRFFTPLTKLYFRWKINYRPRITPVEAPALIVSNHCTDWDPILLGLTIKTHTYFVASEHIYHNKRIARLLQWFQAPIARMKGATAADTAMTVIRRIRKGHCVCVFAEGNRTFNGRTGDIVESTAKLARTCGGSLVTHRFRGGYFTSPRWSGASARKGLITGEIVNVYSREQLKAMTPAEIADIIRRDIFEDAYATQEEWHIPYKGKRIAEHLERAVCLCPRCERMGTMESADNLIRCTACGLAAAYTDYGTLEGEDFPFRTVLEWDEWQAGKLLELAQGAGDACLAGDTEIDLYETTEDFDDVPCGNGKLSLFRDRLECEGLSVPMREITGMNINGPQQLVFTTAGGKHYTVKSKRVRNLRKYLTLYHALTAPDKVLSI